MNFKKSTAEIIVSEISNGNIVPIIGFDMLMHDDQTLQAYLIDRLCDDEFFDDEDDEEPMRLVDNNINNELRQRMKNEGYHGFSILFDHLSASQKGENREGVLPIFPYIEDIVEKEKKHIHLRSNVKEFLNVACPRLIITTIPFDIIEQELDLKYESRYFIAGKEEKDTMVIAYKEEDTMVCLDSSIPSLCVYHLFGATTKIAAASPWVWTERHLLLYLHALHHLSKFLPDNNEDKSKVSLKDALKGSKFLVMGCNLPEWLFQFLLFPLKGTGDANGSYWIDNYAKGKAYDKEKEKDIAYKQLAEQLNSFNCKVKKYSLLEKITTIIKKQKASKPIKDEKEPEYYDFFISYRKEDIEIAKRIVAELSKFECSIWFDDEHNEDLVGDQWAKIRSILERSRHLIPIITYTYLKRFDKDSELQGCGVANLTRQALSFMYPDFSRDHQVLQEGAEEFVCPIFIENESVKSHIGNLTTNFGLYQQSLKDGELPVEFKNVNVRRYDLKREFTDITKDVRWKNLIGKGKTMKEVGFKLK